MRLRSALYRSASVLGWAGAIAKGPAALAVRILRVFVTCVVMGGIGAMFR